MIFAPKCKKNLLIGLHTKFLKKTKSCSRNYLHINIFEIKHCSWKCILYIVWFHWSEDKQHVKERFSYVKYFILFQDWTWRLLVPKPSWLRQNPSCFECRRVLESYPTTCPPRLCLRTLQLYPNYPLGGLFDSRFRLQTFGPLLRIKMYPKVYLPQNVVFWPLWPIPWIFYRYL